MSDYFDEKRWEEEIRNPYWYFSLSDEYRKLKKLQDALPKEEGKKLKTAVYDFFEKHLENGDVFLGNTGKNFDADRKSIDTIVIHHTHSPPGLSKERLSAIALLRLYTVYYANPTYKDDREIQGKPIYSGHFREGRQVFYPYHWIIRGDGTMERLLNDNEIGWHAGNWDINCRSIAITLDNNYEDSIPSDEELVSIANVVVEYYSLVPKDRIFGHREINQKTTCPSNLFLSTDKQTGWKEKLIKLINSNIG